MKKGQNMECCGQLSFMNMELALSWDEAAQPSHDSAAVQTCSISDALILSLSNLGEVDLGYISAVTGADEQVIIDALRGAIYQNPERWDGCPSKGWETAEEYLSGNLVRKWREAKKADAQYKGMFRGNMEAIERMLPPMVSTEEIYITLGSPWVPTDVIDAFILYLCGDPFRYIQCEDAQRELLWSSFQTKHDEITGTWEIPNKFRYCHNVAVSKTYGTERMEALHIMEKTLNLKKIAVMDEICCPECTSGYKLVINQAETATALEKQQKMIKEFQTWVWTDEKRKKRLEKIFVDNYGCVKQRMFDGNFLTFPGLSPHIHLYPHQKNAVARIIFTPNTLLAHQVGAGKTYVMIAAGQELRRMGLSRKNMYVVPNSIVGQWKRMFQDMYPEAKLLCVEPKSFVPKKREDVLKRMRDYNYDGIIMAYSCFEQIPLSRNYYMEELQRKRDMISSVIQEEGKATTKILRKKESLEKALSQLLTAVDDMYDTIYFDELGITRLFVDEAHNFKNIPIETKMDGVLGVSVTGSKKCQDMLDKVRMVQQNNGGKGVVLATGTPVTNSVAEVYVLQQYLQSGELELLGLQNFDSWVGMFAEKQEEFEIDVDTSAYRLATRLVKFHNLPELTALLASVADFYQVEDAAGIPVFSGYEDIVVDKTPAFSRYLDDISVRADDVRTGRVSRREDNMLKITTDGRKAALDLRLVEAAATFSPCSKVARCAEKVAEIYRATQDKAGTQLVFCDLSTPKAEFNIYAELKRLLMEEAISEDQIAFIHSAETAASRATLFARVRRGDVRVLIGSTFKLGMGVNVQNHLVALHHLDVPWRPADMTQREGRILRQGNESEQVHIYRYVMQGSFDAYSWQLLETKQRFIAALLSGSLEQRSGADVDDTVLNYAEVKALAVGNPQLKRRVEAANQLERFTALQRKLVQTKLKLQKELLETTKRIEKQEEHIRNCHADWIDYQKWKKIHLVDMDASMSKEETDRRRAQRAELTKLVQSYVMEENETVCMSYRGFDVVLPAYMTKEKPFVWLSGRGKYRVELGDTEVGNLVRLDNALEGMGMHLSQLRRSLVELRQREMDIRGELNKEEGYSEQIQYYKNQVELLDQKLGVYKA